MPMYTCSVCGETAYSKCAQSRNIFAEDQVASILRAVMCVHQPEGYAKDKFEAKIDFYVSEGETMAEALAQQLKFISRYDNSLGKILCSHKWVMDAEAETCDLGCCKKRAAQ